MLNADYLESVFHGCFILCLPFRFFFTDVHAAPCLFTVNGSSGLISSESSGNYEDCSWVIIAPIQHNIRLQFATFHLPDSSVNGTSYVQVHDGKHSSDTLLGNFTGIKEPFTVQSSDRFMLVKLIKKINVQPPLCNFTAVYTSSTTIGELFFVSLLVN